MLSTEGQWLCHFYLKYVINSIHNNLATYTIHLDLAGLCETINVIHQFTASITLLHVGLIKTETDLF